MYISFVGLEWRSREPKTWRFPIMTENFPVIVRNELESLVWFKWRHYHLATKALFTDHAVIVILFQVCVCVCVCVCVSVSVCVCVCVCLSSLVCVVGYFHVRWCSILVLWVFFFLLNWMFQHDCLDTYCFWVSYMHAFCIFVFASVQRNWACFTWKSALEIRSLLLLLLQKLYAVCSLGCVWNWVSSNNNNSNDEHISRMPFHVKHAQLCWTGVNTKIQNTCIYVVSWLKIVGREVDREISCLCLCLVKGSGMVGQGVGERRTEHVW